MKVVIRDMGEAAEVSSAQENQRSEMLKMLFAALLVIITLYFAISWGSEYLVRQISPETERSWFSKLPDNILIEEDSPKELAKMQLTLNKLITQMKKQGIEPGYDFRLVILNQPQINAFAMPGGTIGVTREMWDKISNEQALAFVLAHELGHFHYRHHLKGLARNLGLGITMSLIFGDVDGTALTQNLIQLLEYKHSRNDETDADEFAARLVYQTYGSLEHTDDLFKLLEQEQSGHHVPAFLQTHPGNQQRIQRLHQLATELK